MNGGLEPRWLRVATVLAIVAGIAAAVWLYSVVAAG
jgi:hypothetical protein